MNTSEIHSQIEQIVTLAHTHEVAQFKATHPMFSSIEESLDDAWNEATAAGDWAKAQKINDIIKLDGALNDLARYVYIDMQGEIEQAHYPGFDEKVSETAAKLIAIVESL